nr:band 4.1-like protein 4 isoform X1 [Ciona intestinalis]|eukprot:XP_002121971.3 band 4.1-like protein 4 isoform X1 [Ciona intestinalis]
MECKCLFLDGKDVSITVKKDATGADLLASVCRYLAIGNKQPFGLVHRGGAHPPTYNWWVRLDKELRKQISGKCKIWAFALVLKFYPLPPKMNVNEDIVRFHSVLQVRQDLLTGKLKCPTHTLSLLASYWLQSEYGEWTSDQVDRQLAEEFRYVRRGKYNSSQNNESDVDFEQQMVELHRCLGSMTPAIADKHFLRLAASLATYGVHFYPAFELVTTHGRSRFGGSGSRIQECGDALLLGIGPKGVMMIKERRSRKQIAWSEIGAVLFKHNKVIIRLQKPDKNGRKEIPLAMESTKQAKVVWKIAIDMHVNFRFQQNSPAAVKIERDCCCIGVKKVKIIPKARVGKARVSRKPAISIISEVPVTKSNKSSPALSKKIFDSNSATKPKQHPSPSARSRASNRKSDSPRTNTSRGSSPVTSRSKSQSPSPTRKTSPKYLDEDSAASSTLRYDDKVASAVPKRMKAVYKIPLENVTCDDGMSGVSDNTDVLCSQGIIENAFSYAESDGMNSIHSWLELCSPKAQRRGREKTRRSERTGREKTRSAPASQISRSRERSPVNELDVDDIHDYRPLIPSKRPIVIRANELRDLSPPHTVHYDDEPVRRRPDRYRSAENVSRKAYPRKVPLTDRYSSQKKLADIYRQEYLSNLRDTRERRSKSMYSLPQRRAESKDRDVYGPIDYYRGISPSSISAVASSGSQRSCDSYLGASNMEERDLFGREYLPVESSFTKRVLSESRLARQRHFSGNLNEPGVEAISRIQTPVARSRRKNVTSWAYGDESRTGQVGSSRSMYDVRQRQQEKEDTIPRIPRFVPSVR